MAPNQCTALGGGGGTRKRHFRLIIPASLPPKPLPAPISGYFRSEEVYFRFYSLPRAPLPVPRPCFRFYYSNFRLQASHFRLLHHFPLTPHRTTSGFHFRFHFAPNFRFYFRFRPPHFRLHLPEVVAVTLTGALLPRALRAVTVTS